MKITKYEHACLTIEINNRILVIDPGVFSSSFAPSDNIDAIVITHEHADHFDPEKIVSITALNPNTVIFATEKVSSQIPNSVVPNTDEKKTIGDFVLQFFGHNHAPIVDDIVPCNNFGIVVNDTLVYPGDSFEVPPTRPQILATPVSAPWLKVNDVMQYIASTKPAKVFPTHNALLSEAGQSVTYNWIRKACDEANSEFIDLQTSENLSV